MDKLRVAEATQERIDMRGTGTLGREEGYIDRRTGHGMITWYGRKYDDKEKREVVYKQFIFDCKPSTAAIF